MAGLVIMQVKDNCVPPNPVSGATIGVSSRTAAISISPTTDQNGICYIYGTAGTYSATVKKMGCVTVQVPITIIDLRTVYQLVRLPCSWCYGFPAYFSNLVQLSKSFVSLLLLLLALFSLFMPVGSIGKLFLFFTFLTSIIVMAGFHAWQDALERIPKWEVLSVREGAPKPENLPEPGSEA